ncbi:unnamed protein product [Scytosiphon promiscuus]
MSKIMVLVAVVVGACAALAASGFRGRQTVVGIDLGTTYSVIGINEAGKIIIIPGTDGSSLLPSVVSFLENGRVAVGQDAVDLLERHPASTIYGAKRFIGREFADSAVSKEAAEHQFRLVQTDRDLSEAWFQIRRSGHPPAVSPQAVGSHVVGQLLQRAAKYLGHSQVSKVVIAVPAKFNARQKAATAEAFRLAGLQVIRTLEEPTAAALAFGLHRKPNVNHILVYDLGGGTLDVSLLFVNDGSVEVLGSDGDNNLGGSDFDQCVTHVLERKLEGSIVPLEDAERAISCSFAAPTCAIHNLYPLSEGLRRLLTDGQTASLECMTLSGEARRSTLRPSNIETGTPSFGLEVPNAEARNQDTSNSDGDKRGHCGLWKPFKLDLTRAEYEHSCASLFDRGVAPVDRLLKFLDLTIEEIDEVVMVGGMTRTPRVRNLLKSHLGVDRLNVDIDPDVVVAYGAATIAH